MLITYKCGDENCKEIREHDYIIHKIINGDESYCYPTKDFKIHLGNKWFTVSFKHGRKERILAIPREEIIECRRIQARK